jgi:3',5'-cyclic AMP phosphodiesterase CpdA
VVAGDLFHQKISVSNEQTMLAAWFLNKLSTIGKVVIIPGNHDFLENNHGRLDSITPIIQLIENDNVTYYRESGVFEDENIRWVVYSLYNHNKPPMFEREDNCTYVGLFHGPINGASTDTGYVFEHGYETSIFAGLDMVLCGDVHKRFSILLIDGYEEMEIDINELEKYIKEGWERC